MLSTPGFQRNIDDAKTAGAVLADGTYLVVGFLQTSASVSGSGNLQVGSAKADFASQAGDGFFVGVDATPVPESSTLFLLGLGLIALAQFPIRRFTKRSLGNTSTLEQPENAVQTQMVDESGVGSGAESLMGLRSSPAFVAKGKDGATH